MGVYETNSSNHINRFQMAIGICGARLYQRRIAVSPLIGSHNFHHTLNSIVRPVWHIGFTVCNNDWLALWTRARYEWHLDEGGLSIKADALLSDGSKIQMNSKWYAVFHRNGKKKTTCWWWRRWRRRMKNHTIKMHLFRDVLFETRLMLSRFVVRQ